MSKEAIKIEFGDIFKGLGNLGDYHITLKDNITTVIHPPQQVPVNIKVDKVTCKEQGKHL